MPYAEVNGTTLHYREEGKGDLLVFVHGFPFDSSMWIEQMEALAPMRRCVAVDLRGFGLSEPTTQPVLSMEQHAADLGYLVEDLGAERVDLVGLSMGGYVALAFAEIHGEMLSSLVLADTKAAPDDEAGKAKRDTVAVKAVIQGRDVLAKDFVDALLAEKSSPFVKGRLRSMVEGTRYESIVAGLMGMKQRPDRTAVLGELTVPVTIVVGDEDAVTTPADAEAMASQIADASVHVIPGAGHLTPVEKPAEIAAVLLDHLRRVDAGSSA